MKGAKPPQRDGDQQVKSGPESVKRLGGVWSGAAKNTVGRGEASSNVKNEKPSHKKRGTVIRYV